MPDDTTPDDYAQVTGHEITCTVPVPAAAIDRLVTVAVHASRGHSAAGLGHYPDAAARAALGQLDDHGLLDQWRERHGETAADPMSQTSDGSP